jgi:hypothetical protein
MDNLADVLHARAPALLATVVAVVALPVMRKIMAFIHPVVKVKVEVDPMISKKNGKRKGTAIEQCPSANTRAKKRRKGFLRRKKDESL